MIVSCMRHASDHNYRNSSFIVDVAMGQIPRSTVRISSWVIEFSLKLKKKLLASVDAILRGILF